MAKGKALILVSSSFPKSGDGSEAAGAFVADLALELAKNVPVRVVAPGRELREESWSPQLTVYRFPAPDQALSNLRPWHPSDLISLLRVIFHGQQAVLRAIDAGPTHSLLALWAVPCGAWAWRASTLRGLPYSVWTLGSDIWVWGHVPGARSLLRRVLRGASRCYADGYQLAADTQNIAQRPVRFLPSTRAIGQGPRKALKAGPPYRLLFLGRWHPNKGVDILLDALWLLPDSAWDRIEGIEIFGGGPLEPTVRTQVKRLQQLCRPVALGGYLAKPEAEAALRRADYLLLPSRIESIPVVFSDAVKLGCAVISTPVGDLPRLHGEAPVGKLSHTATAEAFQVAIQSALETPPSHFQKGLEQFSEKFSMANYRQLLPHESPDICDRG